MPESEPKTLRGIFPVIPTLFHDDDSLDLESQRKVIQFAIQSGAHGVVFPGVASEYNFLSQEERGQLIGLVAEEVGRTFVSSRRSCFWVSSRLRFVARKSVRIEGESMA